MRFDANVIIAETVGAIAAYTGKRPPRVTLHHSLVLSLAYAAEGCARVTGRKPFATVDAVRMAR